jgi:hypothetical protein
VKEVFDDNVNDLAVPSLQQSQGQQRSEDNPRSHSQGLRCVTQANIPGPLSFLPYPNAREVADGPAPVPVPARALVIEDELGPFYPTTLSCMEGWQGVRR